jgi:hypothetical protein
LWYKNIFDELIECRIFREYTVSLIQDVIESFLTYALC